LRKDVGANFTEYVHFGSNVIAEKDQTGGWTDYIVAGGKRIAKADSSRYEISVQGTNTAAGQSTWWQIAGAPQVAVATGDKLYILQNQQGAAAGGIILTFTDGGNSSWGAQDQIGYFANSDRQLSVWHSRVVDLSQYSGKTINGFQVGNSSAASAGSWNIQYAEIVLVKADGTVFPVYNGQQSLSFVLAANNTSGVTGLAATITTDATVSGNALLAQQYYHGDQIGSSRLMTSGGGWPVWQGTFLPYGEEYNPQSTPNHYKFTGKERDAETGLDYFGARYYSNSLGRFITPDWSNNATTIPYADLVNPQSLNLYSYVSNRPTVLRDEDGHDTQCGFFCKLGNWLNGDGFKTDAEVEQAKKEYDQSNRWALINLHHLDPKAVAKLTPKQADELDNALLAGKSEVTVDGVRIVVQVVAAVAAVTLQSGNSNTISKETARRLNEHFGEKLESREWGRALESLKQNEGLPPDFHGKIMSNGDFVNADTGAVIGNIGHYLP
jgi:RHS repeat-associated protein